MFRSRKSGVVFLSWFFVVLWMAIIFILSAQSGDESTVVSGEFVEFAAVFFRLFSPNINDDMVHLLVRKMAHMTEYMILSILLINALRQHLSTKQQIYLYAFVVSSLYAVTDEIHQLFVPARAGSILDVFIDMVGTLLGLLLFELFVQVYKKNTSVL